MKKKVCIHPRRAVNAMKEFLTTACPDVYEALVYPSENEHPMPSSKDFNDAFEWLEALHNYEEKYGQVIKLPITPKMYKMKEKNFCVHPSDVFEDGDDTVRFGYNYELLFDQSYYGVLIVFQDMEERGKHMRGFSRITKCLLHELGHLATYEEVHEQFSEEEIDRMHKDNYLGNYGYIRLPDEYAATQWAIDWLKDPEHRKIAKAFEKKFWACFAAE